ncbi:PKD domain-containing protein [Methanosarcina sp. UBA5]|uniref:PKD domain-containing protein n=1 Tax=Methanosarcina sp. UBA5 TaxID=1915593 RepID=UPI0025F99C23|nr:PKD domain-containing protein [Methanosarcina sp. UBA5]
MASAATEKNASPNINITQITTSGIATHPDIYSDKIVWEEDYSNGYASNIHVYNLSKQEEETEFSASGSPPYPVIYGNTIVWVDWRNGHRDGDRYISSHDVYMYDLSTGKETLITIPPCNAGSHDIYGNRIVWEHGTDTVNIYMYDISTHYLHNITQIGTWRSSFNPAIYGDRVVYQDGRNGFPQIYMYNNSTQTEILITDGKNDSTIEGVNPDIYGDKIVWLNPNGDYGDIHMYDLSTSKGTQITTSGSASNPAIYGNRIVWEDYRNGSPDLYMYDLSTSHETQITTSGLAYDPSIYSNRIVWTYGRYRDSDIYMGTISEEEPELPVAAFSASPTSGKAPLNVGFTDSSTGTPTAWKWTFGDGASSTEKNPKHQYLQEGNYKVTLIVSNAAGSSTATKTNYIKVTTNTRPGIYSENK